MDLNITGWIRNVKPDMRLDLKKILQPFDE